MFKRLPGGRFFFILSGLIISMSYQSKINLLEAETIFIFMKKRIARIYPLHLFTLASYTLIPLSYFIFDKELPSDTLYSLDNFFLSLFMINNWGFSDTLSWNIPSWSISTEFAAYLSFPFLAVLFKKYNIFFCFLFIILAICILSYSYSLNNADSLGDNLSQLGLIRCIVEFFLGMCVWNLYKNIPSITKAGSIFLLLLSIITIYFTFYDYLTEIIFIPLSLSIFLFSMLSYNNYCEIKILRLNVFVFLGEISYSIYLNHFLLRDIFKMAFLTDQSASIIWIIGYLFSVIILSKITYTYIEKPMRNKINSM